MVLYLLRKEHYSVFEWRLAKHLLVCFIVLRIKPRLSVALLGHLVHRSFHVAGRKIFEPLSRLHVLVSIAQCWCAYRCLCFAHVVQQSTDIFASQVGAQSPRSVDIAKRRSQIWHTRIGTTFISPRVCEVDRLRIDNKLHFAKRHELDARRSNNDVSAEMTPRLEFDASRGKSFNGVCSNFSFTRFNSDE